MEWTFRGDALYVLQARPVTARAGDDGAGAAGDKPWERSDRRSWYLSLTRSLESLKKLQKKIEESLLPGMDADAEALSGVNVSAMGDLELAGEIDRRRRIHGGWVDRYWADLIPFAHGSRLFGQFYNDTVRPGDPFEFTSLLGGAGLEGVERNRRLAEIAARVRRSKELREHIEEKLRTRRFEELDPWVSDRVDAFMKDFGDTAGTLSWGKGDLLALVLRMSEAEPARGGAGSPGIEERESGFLNRFTGKERERARELLEIGRASYRLRDNDNLHLARVEAQLARAVDAGRKRLRRRGIDAALFDAGQVAETLVDPSKAPVVKPVQTAAAEPVELKDNPRLVPVTVTTREGGFRLSARQLTGQPAGRGIAAGKARVVLGGHDLLAFEPGEVLVCDAIDPAMTFVVPLASGVVERRGGMLIHGAIIAREYGLPCVTGVPDATSLIKTGDSLVVDGYLGIVTLEERGV
jgi:pyruvate,water dikinase